MVKSDGTGNYLALPYMIGRSKSEVFSFVWNRVAKKVTR